MGGGARGPRIITSARKGGGGGWGQNSGGCGARGGARCLSQEAKHARRAGLTLGSPQQRRSGDGGEGDVEGGVNVLHLQDGLALKAHSQVLKDWTGGGGGGGGWGGRGGVGACAGGGLLPAQCTRAVKHARALTPHTPSHTRTRCLGSPNSRGGGGPAPAAQHNPHTTPTDAALTLAAGGTTSPCSPTHPPHNTH